MCVCVRAGCEQVTHRDAPRFDMRRMQVQNWRPLQIQQVDSMRVILRFFWGSQLDSTAK